MIKKLKESPVWIKIALCAVLLAIITGATIGVLALVSPREKVVDSATAQEVTASEPKIAGAQKLLEDYKASSDIQDRSTLYSEVVNNPTNTYIRYTSDKYPYGITVSAPYRVQYQLNSANETVNPASFISSTESFLSGLDVTKRGEQTLQTLTSSLFEGVTVICQTDNTQAVGGRPATYGLACVDASTIKNSYDQLGSLFALTEGSLSSDGIKSLTQTDIVEKKNTLTAITTLNKDDSSTMYYFVTANQKDWTYLGERPTPMVDDQDSFTIPAKLQQAINSSVYKEFLKTYIR